MVDNNKLPYLAMPTIKTTDNHDVKVDDKWYPLLSQFTWTTILSKNGSGKRYAQKTMYLFGKYVHILMHRVITSSPRAYQVDHINGDPLDNRESNLRVVTRSQNKMNSIIPVNNSSGTKGVNWHKRAKKWAAYITADYKRIHLGYFISREDARKAREDAEKKYFGEYSFKN